MNNSTSCSKLDLMITLKKQKKENIQQKKKGDWFFFIYHYGRVFFSLRVCYFFSHKKKKIYKIPKDRTKSQEGNLKQEIFIFRPLALLFFSSFLNAKLCISTYVYEKGTKNTFSTI